VLFKHSGAVAWVFFQPDSRQLGVVTVANPGHPEGRPYTVQRFHLDGRLAHTRVLPAPRDAYFHQLFPESRKIVAAHVAARGPEILIWDLDTGELQRCERKSRADFFFLDSAGKELALWTAKPAAAPGLQHWECIIIDLRQKTLPRTFSGKGSIPLGFSPDLRRYLSVKPLGNSEESVVALGDSPTGKVLWEHRVHGALGDCHFARNGERVCLAGQNQVVYVYDCSTGAEVRALRGHRRQVTRVALSADGRWLASADAGYEIRVWAVADETN
jgi:WD40 repeat protein